VRIQTLPNHVHLLKSFFYSGCRLELRRRGFVLVATLQPGRNARVHCSCCRKPCKVYDSLETHLFDFVPLWNIPVQLEYRMRRVNCPDCGVKVEKVPWANEKSHITKAFELFFAQWARKLSWQEVVSGEMVCPGDAIPSGTDQAVCKNRAYPPAPDHELV